MRRGSRAWGSAATGRARRRFGRARCAELCTLSRRRVVPVRGDSALARERVAGGDAARRLGERRDPASQNRPRRHRDGWEGSNRDRSAAGNESRPFQAVQQKYLAFSRVSFRLKSARVSERVGLMSVLDSARRLCSGVERGARGKPEVMKATEPREARAEKQTVSSRRQQSLRARARPPVTMATSVETLSQGKSTAASFAVFHERPSRAALALSPFRSRAFIVRRPRHASTRHRLTLAPPRAAPRRPHQACSACSRPPCASAPRTWRPARTRRPT